MEQIYLTRRNLETLLKKLDDPSSFRTIQKIDTQHSKYPCSTPVMVTAVEDEDYYDREPGVMKEDEQKLGN